MDEHLLDNQQEQQNQLIIEQEDNLQINQQGGLIGQLDENRFMKAVNVFAAEYDEKTVKNQLEVNISRQYKKAFTNKTLTKSQIGKRKKTAINKMASQKTLKENVTKSQLRLQSMKDAHEDPMEEWDGDQVLEVVENFNPEQMAYTSDKDFIKKYAENSAKIAYAKEASEKVLEKVKEFSEATMNKILIIKKLAEDYKLRMELLSSPYYVLLAGKDLNKFLDGGEEEGGYMFMQDRGLKDYIKKYRKLSESRVGKKKNIKNAMIQNSAVAAEELQKHITDYDAAFRRRMRRLQKEQEEAKEREREAQKDRETAQMLADLEPQMKTEREIGEQEMKNKLQVNPQISKDYSVKALEMRERSLADSEHYLAKYQRLKQEVIDGKLKAGDNDYETVERFDQLIAEKHPEIEEKKKWINRIKNVNKNNVPLVIAKDKYYEDSMQDGAPVTEPLFEPGKPLTISPEIRQGLNTCYFMSILYGLIASGREDYIKNTLIKEYGTEGKQAVVRLHDADGLPVDIVVDKTRVADGEGGPRALWIHMIEKAVMVLMTKTNFKKIEDKRMFLNSSGLVAKNVDYDEISEKCKAGQDFCEDKALSKFFISKSSETMGYMMILGKDCERFDNHDKRGQGIARDQRASMEGNKNIGRIKEFLAHGKMIIASTASKNESEYWKDKPKEAGYDKANEVSPDHVIVIKSVDEASQTIVYGDSEKGREVSMTFKDFRSVISDFYVTDIPGAAQ